MYYHASNIGGLKELKPHISNHGKSWVYFSSKRENILVYLSNSVEKHIKQKHNRPLKQYIKWASYGITEDGRVRIEEYYPNAMIETFKGVSGYIYSVNELADAKPRRGIKDVYVTQDEVNIDACEYVVDAYEEMIKAEQQGKIVIERFETISKQKQKWVEKTIINEYNNTDNEDYKEFLLDKFVWLKDKIKGYNYGLQSNNNISR